MTSVPDAGAEDRRSGGVDSGSAGAGVATMRRWVDRPRGNVALDAGASVARLAHLLIVCIWLCAAAYGVVLVLFAG